MEKLEPKAQNRFGVTHLEILFGRKDYANAALLQLGVNDPAKIQVE